MPQYLNNFAAALQQVLLADAEVVYLLPTALYHGLPFGPGLSEPNRLNAPVSQIYPVVLTLGASSFEIVVAYKELPLETIGGTQYRPFRVLRRAQGTTAQEWPVGTPVSIRFTAGAAEALALLGGDSLLTQDSEILTDYTGDVLVPSAPMKGIYN